MAVDLTMAGIIVLVIFALLIVLGIFFAFFGERIISTLAIVIGAIIGAALGFGIGTLVLMLVPVGEMIAIGIIAICVILGLVFGAWSAKRMLHGFIAFSIAALAFLICIGVANSFGLHMYMVLIIAFLAALVVFVVAMLLAQKLLCVLTAGMGAIMVSYSVHTLLTSLAPFQAFISNIIALVLLMGLAVAGSIFQLEARRKGKSKQPPRRGRSPPPRRKQAPARRRQAPARRGQARRAPPRRRR